MSGCRSFWELRSNEREAMKANRLNSLGDFTVFGFTRRPETFLRHTLPTRLGIAPEVVDFGPAGHFFFYTTYGDVEETEEVIGLKLGLTRSPQSSALSTKQLIDQGLLTPRSVKADAIRGNALLACFSKKVPRFSVYKTLLSLPQLFYSIIDGDLVCTDTPRCHAILLERVEICEQAIPQHFLFRYALGRYSYYRDVYRLLPGELFTWDGGNLDIRQVRNLQADPEDPVFAKADAVSISALFKGMLDVMGAYISDAQASGRVVANLLSGGIDSSIIQLMINQNLPASAPRKSYSYAVRLPNFEYEIEYAREASDVFQTEHTFVDVHTDDFLDLMAETTDGLAQPVSSEAEPCMYALGKHIAAYEDDTVHFFTSATGADTLYGLAIARKINLIEKVRYIPKSDVMLRTAANFFGSQSTKRHALRQIADILPELSNPDSYKAPANTIATYTDIDVARRCFGDDVVRQALKYRRSLEAIYLDSPSFIEKIHMIDFLSDAYENAVINNLMFLAQGREQITPFLDEDFIRLNRAFPPQVRYLDGHEIKPLLKQILEQYSTSNITKKPKGYSVFSEDLFKWMKSGHLRDMIYDIDRPDFISKSELESLLNQVEYPELDNPRGWFLWNLLTFDYFRKQIVDGASA
jgi:asparagine synthetase B (glutamine-hydrolysing)